MRVTAYDPEGNPYTTQGLLRLIAPTSPNASRAAQAAGGIYVTDLDGNPAGGRPWWVADSTAPILRWEGPKRVKIGLPWPIREDGFSTVWVDHAGTGYADGDALLLNEDIAETQYRLLRESLRERTTAWDPLYKTARTLSQGLRKIQETLAHARRADVPGERAGRFDAALTEIALAWGELLFQHGAQAARRPKIGSSLRWGLTLDDSLSDRINEYPRLLSRLETSGANWVRLVFRANARDFSYADQRSFNEYDRLIEELSRRRIHVTGCVLDSVSWPAGLSPEEMSRRTEHLVLRYKRQVRSWEVASEPNGNWLGGALPLPQRDVRRIVIAAAAAVKRIDRSLETVATLYWWEGTAGDDVHPTFTWLRAAIPDGVFSDIDLVGLNVYPEDNPMGVAFDPVFRRFSQYFPTKRIMLGALGYGEASALQGYWWLDPKDMQSARKDLLILYTGAACSIPRSAGGGFWWNALDQMLGTRREPESLLKVFQETVSRLTR